MYYGQCGIDKVIHQAVFQNKRDGFFVECGAYDGTTESTCRFFMESMDWRGINIEPSQAAFNRLKVNRPDEINLNVALSDRLGFAHFTDTEGCGQGSLKHYDQHLAELSQKNIKTECYRVQTMTWDSVVATWQIPHVDLFVLDVEGHEEAVLRGMNQVLPEYICIEFGWNGFDQTVGWMKTKGYHFVLAHHVNGLFRKNV